MSMFGPNGFDSQAKENNEGGRTIYPEGEYDVVLVKSEVKSTKDNSGKYLNLDFQITKGEFQNQHIFEKLNLWLAETDEKKKTAVKIAKANLSELCRAVNVLTPKDSCELHNKALKVRLGVRETPEYGKQNNIKKYMPRSNVQQAPQTQQPEQQQPVPAVASGNPFA